MPSTSEGAEPADPVRAQLATWRAQRWRFHAAVALAVVAVPPALIGLTVTLVGVHRTPAVRAEDDWLPWLVVAVVSTAAVAGATVLASGLPRHPVTRRSEIRFAAGYGPVRRAYFGPPASWPVVVVPVLATLPVVFAESAQLPQDPATGQAGVDVGAMTAGIVLAVGIVLLRELTGRALTHTAVTAWLAWAWYAQDAVEPTAGWVGAASIAAVLLALAGTVVSRRLGLPRG